MIFTYCEYHKSLIYSEEKFSSFIGANLAYVREYDLRKFYETVWKNKFRALCGHRVEDNGTVGCIRVKVQSSNGGDCYSRYPWRVDFNQTPENEAEKLTNYIVAVFGSLESFKIHQRYSDVVSGIKLEGNKLTGKQWNAHVDSLIDFVDWLASGIIAENHGPAQETMRALGLVYNSGKFKVTHKGITIETWLNGKIVLSGLTTEHCERWQVLFAAMQVKVV